MTTERQVNAFVRQLRAQLLAAVRSGGSVSYLCPEVTTTSNRADKTRRLAYVISVRHPPAPVTPAAGR